MANKADEALLVDYGERLSDFEAAALTLEDSCRRICTDLDLKDAWVTKRVKGRTSLAEKLDWMRSKNQPYASLDDVPDLVGARIVVDDRGQAKLVTRCVLEKLPIDLPLTSSRRLAVDQLGYRARHFIARVEIPNGRKITCELQIRSLLQHAWAQSQRNMDVYKGKLAPPDRIKRQLNILSGILEMADERLDDAIIDNQLIHAYPGITARLQRESLRSFVSEGPMRSILGRHGVAQDAVDDQTRMNELQIEDVIRVLRENDIRTLRDAAINLFEYLPMLLEVLAWPKPMIIREPVILLQVTSLIARRNMRDVAQIAFLTPKDQEELARRLGAQNPGMF